jgi:hypothetical protein
LAIPAISETSGVNCMQNFKTLKPVAVQMICFLKQNGLIEIYYLKLFKTRPIKQIVVFGCNTCRKNEPEACFYLFPRCGVKAKYVFSENVFGSKNRVERRKHGEVLY